MCDAGYRIVNSGIPICLIAALRRLLNFLVELFRDEASKAARGIFQAALLKARKRETSSPRRRIDYRLPLQVPTISMATLITADTPPMR